MDMMSPQVTALRDNCQALIEQAAVVKDAVLDHRRQMWCAVPSFDSPVDLDALQNSQPSSEAWFRVADELTNIWMDAGNTPQNHGVLVCEVPEVLEAIKLLNQHKQAVQFATHTLKEGLLVERELEEHGSVDKALLGRLALANAEFLTRGRDHAFHRILRSLKLPSLNFIRAQKQIRVLPETVARVAYTWNKNQYRKRRIDADTLQALSQHFDRQGNTSRADEIRHGVTNCRIQTDPLFALAYTPPSLRANYKWWDNANQAYRWSHCLATGILVVPQSQRPQIRWKPEPSVTEIKQARKKWLAKVDLEPVEVATRLELYRHVR